VDWVARRENAAPTAELVEVGAGDERSREE
jgi:hypothetical protein